jgi:hypothetical protein
MDMAQRRICFTELAPKQLAAHADVFGPFALEFDAETLKSFMALPVVYVPRSDGDRSSLGETLVIQLMDALCILDRMARVSEYIGAAATGGRQNFEFGFTGGSTGAYDLDVRETARTIAGLTHGTTPPEMLRFALEGFLSLFYPADAEPHHGGPLAYYRQREWRIAGNVARRGVELMGLPNERLKERLLELDPDFWGRDFPKEKVDFTNPSAQHFDKGQRVVDWTYVFQGIDDRQIIGAARRVIVPREALETARTFVAKHKTPPPVVAIADLAGA